MRKHDRELGAVNWSFVVPALAVIIAALVTALSGIWVSYLDRQKALIAEKQKLQSELILKAVSTSDQVSASRNLKFFVDAGFLDDPQGKIAELARKGQVPVLPAQALVAERQMPPDKCESGTALLMTSQDLTIGQLYMETCAYLEGPHFRYIVRVENRGTQDIPVTLDDSFHNSWIPPGSDLLQVTVSPHPPTKKIVKPKIWARSVSRC